MLSTDETDTLFDLYAKANNTVSPDIAEYINQHDIVIEALRTAKDNKTNDYDWLRFIEQLKKMSNDLRSSRKFITCFFNCSV